MDISFPLKTDTVNTALIKAKALGHLMKGLEEAQIVPDDKYLGSDNLAKLSGYVAPSTNEGSAYIAYIYQTCKQYNIAFASADQKVTCCNTSAIQCALNQQKSRQISAIRSSSSNIQLVSSLYRSFFASSGSIHRTVRTNQDVPGDPQM